jgi:cyclopropane fatty-acyl-phospholipid synthase-like methyltransferase/uncharacterized protein YbaR (Trm112 family)
MNLLDVIRCPQDNQKLEYGPKKQNIFCQTCGAVYPMAATVPVLFDEEKASEVDIRQKRFYEDFYEKRRALGQGNAGHSLTGSETVINRAWRQVRDFYARSKSVNEVFACFKEQFSFQGGEKVLEIGCGFGTPGTEECIKHKDRISYVGLDFAVEQLLWLKESFTEKGAAHFKVVNADVLDEGLAHEMFDIVFGRGILHHFDKATKPRLAKRIYSLLKPGSKAFFMEPLNTNPVMKYLRVVTKPFRPNLIWEHPFSAGELKDFVSIFDGHSIHCFEGLSMLSLSTAFNKTLFELSNKAFRRVDKALSGLPLYKHLFTKSIIVVYKK